MILRDTLYYKNQQSCLFMTRRLVDGLHEVVVITSNHRCWSYKVMASCYEHYRLRSGDCTSRLRLFASLGRLAATDILESMIPSSL